VSLLAVDVKIVIVIVIAAIAIAMVMLMVPMEVEAMEVEANKRNNSCIFQKLLIPNEHQNDTQDFCWYNHHNGRSFFCCGIFY
jgi:hypothetical protein